MASLYQTCTVWQNIILTPDLCNMIWWMPWGKVEVLGVSYADVVGSHVCISLYASSMSVCVCAAPCLRNVSCLPQSHLRRAVASTWESFCSSCPSCTTASSSTCATSSPRLTSGTRRIAWMPSTWQLSSAPMFSSESPKLMQLGWVSRGRVGECATFHQCFELPDAHGASVTWLYHLSKRVME